MSVKTGQAQRGPESTSGRRGWDVGIPARRHGSGEPAVPVTVRYALASTGPRASRPPLLEGSGAEGSGPLLRKRPVVDALGRPHHRRVKTPATMIRSANDRSEHVVSPIRPPILAA